MCHRQPLDDLSYRHVFGALGFQEFEPRGRGGKEIADFDDRSAIQARRADAAFGAALDAEGDAARAVVLFGFQFQMRNRADRWQRFAAEAERADVEQIFFRQLRRRVTLDAQRQIAGAHARTVVGDANE